LLAQVWTHWGLNWFFLPNPIFAICLNFQQQNPLKNQYLPHLSSENYEINSIKSDWLSGFQHHQQWPQIPIQFSVSILFSFHWENGSKINSYQYSSSKARLASINFIRLEGELQPTLGSLGQLLITKIILSKVSNCKWHLLKFVRIPNKEKFFQFLFKNQQCQEVDKQEMPQLGIETHVSPTTLNNI